MAPEAKEPGNWIYPDREAWDKLMNLRPRPRAVMEKPPWWRGSWPAQWPGKPTAAALSNDRKLAIVRKQLIWAQNCFYHAQSVLPDGRAKQKAGRIADILGRARKAVDQPEKADVLDLAAVEFARVGKYDPAQCPRAFVETAGQSISAAGQIMETSRFGSVAYWGRVLVRAGGFFRAMKYDLPGEG